MSNHLRNRDFDLDVTPFVHAGSGSSLSSVKCKNTCTIKGRCLMSEVNKGKKMQTVREALSRAKIDVKPLDDLDFDLDLPLSDELITQLADACEYVDASYYGTVYRVAVSYLVETQAGSGDEQLRQKLSGSLSLATNYPTAFRAFSKPLELKYETEIGMSCATDSLCRALRTLERSCTVAALRELLSLPEIPPPLSQVFNSKVGWLLKLQRRFLPRVDPGGTPSSRIDSFPGRLTEARFQDLEDLVGLDSGDFQRLTASLKIPKGSAYKVLQQAKALVGEGKKVLYHTLENASGIYSLITTVKEAQNGNVVNKVALIPQKESDPACLFLRFLYSLCDRIFMCLSEPMLAELQNETGEAETTRVVECEVETPSIQDRCEFEKGFAQNLSLPPSDSPWKMIQCDNSVGFVCCEEINESTLVSPIRGQIPAYYFAPYFKDLLHGKELCTDTLRYHDKLALLRLLNPTAAQSVEDGNKGSIETLQRVAKERIKLMLSQHFRHEWDLLQLEAPRSPSDCCADLDQSRLTNIAETCLSKTTSVIFLFEEFCPQKTPSELRDFLNLTEQEMKQRIIQFGSDPPRHHVTLSTLSSLGFEPHFASEITFTLKGRFKSQCKSLATEIQAAACSNPDEICCGASFSLELDTAIRKETPHTEPGKVILTMFQQSTDKANPLVSFQCKMARKVPRHLKFTVVKLNLEKITDGRSYVTLAPPFCFDLEVATVLGCFLLSEGKVMVFGADTADPPSNYLISVHREDTCSLSWKLPKKGCISHVNFCGATRMLVIFSLADDGDLASVKGIFPVPKGQKVVVTFPKVAKLFDFETRIISELPQFDGPALFLGPEFFVTLKPSLPVISGTPVKSCVVSVRSCLQPSKVQHWETNLLNSHLLPSTLLANFPAGVTFGTISPNYWSLFHSGFV
ncbi:hypothetical protein Pelo_13812 [Pelomyxa schiedti]|nr:hypothetical protein Pelo_13812 [Pelomyxa schiedti]